MGIEPKSLKERERALQTVVNGSDFEKKIINGTVSFKLLKVLLHPNPPCKCLHCVPIVNPMPIWKTCPFISLLKRQVGPLLSSHTFLSSSSSMRDRNSARKQNC